MVKRVHAALFELEVILFGPGRKRQEAHEYFLLTCLFSLGEEFLGVVGVFKILPPVITADMAGEEFFIKIKT